MLAVFSDGTAVGTVGGGNVEFEATAVAKSLLQSQQDALREFRLIQGDAASLDMVCGGDLTLPWEDDDNPNAYVICPHCGYKNTV